MEETEEENEEETEDVCQCCGRRRGRRIGPWPSKRFVCGPCLEDPSPTFEGCRHGETSKSDYTLTERICPKCANPTLLSEQILDQDKRVVTVEYCTFCDYVRRPGQVMGDL